MKRWVLRIALLAAIGIVGWLAYYMYRQRLHDSGSSFHLSPVLRQDVIATISATGTIVPEDVVDVGAQVNGQIAAFGVDSDGKPVDYRSSVMAGSVLAKIDDAIYAAQVASDEASLLQAEAAVKAVEATLQLNRARLDQTQRD